MAETKPHDRKPRSQPVRRRKRTVVIILLLLAGGAVVNVAVTWGVRFVLDKDPTVIVQGWHTTLFGVSIRPPRDDSVRHAFLVHRVTSCCDDFLLRTSKLSALTSPGRYEHDQFVASLPAGSWFRLVRGDDDRYRLADALVHSEYASGWPLLSLRYRTQYVETPDLPWSDNTPSVLVGGIEMPEAAGQFRHGLPLPMTPILPGFLVNTIFYALLLWLLFVAPFAVRRTIRRGRGRCGSCAYPIGVSPVCTECGAVL